MLGCGHKGGPVPAEQLAQLLGTAQSGHAELAVAQRARDVDGHVLGVQLGPQVANAVVGVAGLTVELKGVAVDADVLAQMTGIDHGRRQAVGHDATGAAQQGREPPDEGAVGPLPEDDDPVACPLVSPSDERIRGIDGIQTGGCRTLCLSPLLRQAVVIAAHPLGLDAMDGHEDDLVALVARRVGGCTGPDEVAQLGTDRGGVMPVVLGSVPPRLMGPDEESGSGVAQPDGGKVAKVRGHGRDGRPPVLDQSSDMPRARQSEVGRQGSAVPIEVILRLHPTQASGLGQRGPASV